MVAPQCVDPSPGKSSCGTTRNPPTVPGRITNTITVDAGRSNFSGAVLILVGDLIWVANPDASTVSVIDPTTQTVNTITGVSRPRELIEAAGLTKSVALGASPDGLFEAAGLIWVTNGSAGTVSVIDPTT